MLKSSSFSTVTLFGIDIAASQRKVVVDRVLSEADAGIQTLVVTLNAEMVVNASADSEFAQILKSSKLVIPDGMSIVRSGRRILGASLEVYPGVEFAYDLLAEASTRNGYSVYMLGAKDGTASAAADWLRGRLPDLNIAGCHHGYFRGNDDAIVEMINESRATILFAGLGSPFQEKWLEQQCSRLKPRILVGVGGSFEVWAGTKKRAPRWVSNAGLEWLYRAATDPGRIRRLSFIPRYLALERKEIARERLKRN